MLKDYQKKILDLYGEMKAQLAGLYLLFAKRFPDHAVYWADMAEGAREHAEWLTTVRGELAAESMTFDEGSTKTYTVKAFIDYLRDIEAKTRADQVTLLNALSLTRDIEKSLMVREMFDHFRAKSPAGEQNLMRLKKKIARHVEKAEKEFRAYRP